MQRVEPTVSLKTETRSLRTRRIPIGKAIAICLFITIAFRVVLFGLVSLLGLVTQLDFLTNILKGINDLNYLVALPVGIAIYMWANSSDEESLLI
jgi:hypothetical protein